MNLKIIYSFTIILCAQFALPALANQSQFENLSRLILNAGKYIKNSELDTPYPTNVSINSLSKKLKLKQCNAPIEFEFSNQSKKTGRTLLRASCKTPVKWRINIPVTITVFQDVLVLKHPVIRSQSIDEDDVIVKKMDNKFLIKGFYTHTDQLRHLETRRNLQKNTILTPYNLAAKKLIKSGQQVSLEIFYSGLSVKVSATALQSASKGQLIKVRNNNSLKTIEGVVKSAGIVQVNM